MRCFFLACLVIFLVGCTSISQSDFLDHQSEYKALVDYLLANDLETFNESSVVDLPESEKVIEIMGTLGVSRVSKNRETGNHVLIIKKVIPPGYYQGYLYIVDTSLPIESDLYNSFDSINDHWAIVADD